MKREQARIEALRQMPYAQYLRTPQWQQTQAAAITRAANRCQVCKAEDGSLRAYHTTSENLGCEQESDLLVVCAACAQVLRRNGSSPRTAPEEGPPEMPEEEEGSPDFSFGKKAAVFAPAALIGMGLPALLHAPLPAELFGLGAAIALAANSPRLYAEMKESLPEPLVDLLDGMAERKHARAETGEWSTWDRLMGRHLYDPPTDEGNEPEEGVLAQAQVSVADGHLRLAHDLCIPLGDLAGKAIFVVGMRRSGKSTLAALLAEQLGQYLLPMLIPDFEGDLLSLAEMLPRALIMHGPGTDISAYRNESQRVLTLEVSIGTAPQWGYAIFEQGYQVLLDLSSYPTLEEAVAVQIALIRGMFRWAEEHPAQRTTAAVYLDEAQRYLPENLRDSTIQDKVLVGELLRVYSDILAIGGKRGIAPVIITQRMAQVNKKIMAQSEVFFILRQTSDNDVDRVMEYVNKDSATRAQIAAFAQGQGVYIASDGTQRLTRFEQRRSSGNRSHTPDAKAAQRYADITMTLPTTPSPPPTRPSPPSVSARSPCELEGQRTRQEMCPVQSGAASARRETSQPGRYTKVLEPEVQTAYDAYVPGMTYRELGAVLGYRDPEARAIWLELKKRGLLQAPRDGSSEPSPASVSQEPGKVRSLSSLPHPQEKAGMEELPMRPIEATDLAKAFALWQAGAASVRKLEAAAKAAGYPWSNGKCRALIEAMKEHKLISRDSESVL